MTDGLLRVHQSVNSIGTLDGYGSYTIVFYGPKEININRISG
jgi:hypothetical protein